MRLKNLIIRRKESWEKGGGTLEGTLVLDSPENEVKLNLTDEVCRLILPLIGVNLKTAAEETAAFLYSEANSLTLEAPKS